MNLAVVSPSAATRDASRTNHDTDETPILLLVMDGLSVSTIHLHPHPFPYLAQPLGARKMRNRDVAAEMLHHPSQLSRQIPCSCLAALIRVCLSTVSALFAHDATLLPANRVPLRPSALLPLCFPRVQGSHCPLFPHHPRHHPPTLSS
ncbi:hypothetical protein XA68_10780 [Ophiocordyceps unilateralis]|uniref:Uncharacterized protein n=1 Tax=Ophiocordyceps unilateralis TaxID=268505 RepID=A0A2A9PI29_OPHUN|nr:hypothetical protein XA68_10780 [Ophiocordyceps unilateralis]